MRTLERERFCYFPEVTQHGTKLIWSPFKDPSGLRPGWSLDHVTWAPPIRCALERIQIRSELGAGGGGSEPMLSLEWQWRCAASGVAEPEVSGVQCSVCLVQAMASVPRNVASMCVCLWEGGTLLNDII